MKREIKFRAWDNEEDKMFDPLHHDHYDFNEIMAIDDRFTVMQFTGLKDKNGKEVYGGDIVRTSHKYIPEGVVSFWISSHAFEIVDLADDKLALGSKYDWSDIEVIGNIYENHELIRK